MKGNIYKDKKNGKDKEYFNTGKLEFEGEYIDCKKWDGKRFNFQGNEQYTIKNGKGKVKEFFSNGIISFEGDYLNGERNGNGIEYYDNGKVKFKGQYSNNKKNGKGKEYYRKGDLLFEGEYSDGRKWNGNLYDANGNLSDEYVYGRLKSEKSSCIII